jgi:hypothetical protein
MSTCNVHVTIDPYSGTYGAPVTGEWHYDLANPDPFAAGYPLGSNTLLHVAADLIPDEARNLKMSTWTGGNLCIQK